MDLGDELRELLDVREIAREQNHAADERRLKPLAFVRGEGLAAQVDHQRTQRHGLSLYRQTMSTTVPAGTRSNSSVRSPFAIRIQPIDPGTPIGSESGAPWM